MRISSRCVFLGTLIALGGCASTGVQVLQTGNARVDEGLHVRQVTLLSEAPPQTLVCYSEIRDQHLQGISCQNALGLPLFAAGREGQTWQLQATHPHWQNAKIQNIISYLSLDLLGGVTTRPALNREYHNGTTRIFQAKQPVAEVSQ